jgi:lysophospholipase L1-like esterase
MKRSIYAPFLAATMSLALVACQSGLGSGVVPANPFPVGGVPSTTGTAVLARIVGVGDSLTAGVQSNAMLGQTAANPLFPGTSPLPVIPAGQPVGWWADLYNQVNGANAALNVMPLIKTPGTGTFLIPTNTGSFTSLQTNCTGLNAFAFDPNQALANERVNGSLIPYDLGIPGQMVHEALYQVAPEGPCPVLNVAPGSIFYSESTNFYPVMANFPGMTQVQAARSLKPTLTTVWLGANDLLKYAFSNGAFGPTPTSSLQADLQTIVQTMQQAGSQVVIANLPDVLSTPLFIPVAALPLVLQGFGVPASVAAQISAGVAAANGLGAGSYYTFQALGAIIPVAQGAPIPTNLVAQNLALPGSFATQVQSQNTAYNNAIGSVAAATGAVLVDVHALFVQAATQGVPINPPKCCTLTIGGGLTSFDNLHPSNTGYAIVANAFIAAINAKFGTTIAPVNVAAVYATDPYAPH